MIKKNFRAEYEKKKKVAILSWDCAYQEHEGGKCTHIDKLAAMLAKDGYDIHIFTRRGEERGTALKKEGLNYHYIQIGIRVMRWPKKAGSTSMTIIPWVLLGKG
ncbi:MAG: hypothetical protein ACMUJM_13395 [bacterium]